jgi:RNA polymerase sigma-70 factor (ECF subfamily)
MRALQRINSFTWQGKDFGAWLVTIARNRCHDHFKSARFRMETSVGEIYETAEQVMPAHYEAPEHNLLVQETRAAVRTALGELKSEQAEVLYHRFIADLDVT